VRTGDRRSPRKSRQDSVDYREASRPWREPRECGWPCDHRFPAGVGRESVSTRVLAKEPIEPQGFSATTLPSFQT
jgi:hypothetical protein